MALSAYHIINVLFRPDVISRTSVFALFTLILLSCQKNNDLNLPNGPIHHLETFIAPKIKIGQGLSIYDATALNDSLSFVQPPTSRYYKWKVAPDNGCISFTGNFKHGRPNAIVTCSGNYQLYAHVFDSASNNIIAITDTIAVEVTNDTLFPAVPIIQHDVLMIEPSIVKEWFNVSPSDPFPQNRPPDAIKISLHYSTTEEYEYHSSYVNIKVTSAASNNVHLFTFNDSVSLKQHPYVDGVGTFNRVEGFIDLKDLQFGVPANINITWLGISYSGKITLIDENRYSFEWDNDGSAKFSDGCCRVY